LPLVGVQDWRVRRHWSAGHFRDSKWDHHEGAQCGRDHVHRFNVDSHVAGPDPRVDCDIDVDHTHDGRRVQP
jgi:6-pyruvoyl-tetrahydropterin synthase